MKRHIIAIAIMAGSSALGGITGLIVLAVTRDVIIALVVAGLIVIVGGLTGISLALVNMYRLFKDPSKM